MQLAGQSDTGSRREEGDGPVLQNGEAEESRVSKNGLNLGCSEAKHSTEMRYTKLRHGHFSASWAVQDSV